jgi:hypothetical protein
MIGALLLVAWLYVLTTIALALGVVAWDFYSSLHYSLRTLLVAMTLVALALGLFALSR